MKPYVTYNRAAKQRNGFRSRLEYKWARQFDEWNVVWEYEPAKLWLDRIKRAYTPDFWLPDYNAYVEVKPTLPPNCSKYEELPQECVVLAYLSAFMNNEENIAPMCFIVSNSTFDYWWCLHHKGDLSWGRTCHFERTWNDRIRHGLVGSWDTYIWR